MRKLTYISLFSSAGVGCYGFKEQGFECIATSELIERRIDIQKANNKCKYLSGYISGDITLKENQNKIFNEINLWEKEENLNQVDVIIATPPCQGMSVANHHKTEEDKTRNSLVVESIKVVKKIKPRFFIFENVKAFLKTICTYDNNDITIEEAIHTFLGGDYNIFSRVINFKDYGVPSSRTRTLVIGVNKNIKDISPFFLFPKKKLQYNLLQTIGNFPSMKEMGEIDPTDIYHSFRAYPEYMRDWIKYLKPGENAFQHNLDEHKPYKLVDGKRVSNQQKNSDKYKRNEWDKVCPCIHTRNDQLASQSTIHPVDDRVFSIRELMSIMSIPKSFIWNPDEVIVNNLELEDKKLFLKKNEMKIRQSIGEAVPTKIFEEIAKNLKNLINSSNDSKTIKTIIEAKNLFERDNLIKYLKEEVKDENFLMNFPFINKIVELCNSNKEELAAYYTRQDIVFPLVNELPSFSKSKIRILEPSVGFGAFIPSIISKYSDKNIEIDVLDIDANALEILEIILRPFVTDKVSINFINSDFILYNPDFQYDIIIGNPPYKKLKSEETKKYDGLVNTITTKNIFAYFIEKSLSISKNLSFVIPKSFLYTSEFNEIRNLINKNKISKIIDFGEKAFQGVKIETIGIVIDLEKENNEIIIESYIKKTRDKKQTDYIFDTKYPTWLIYRDLRFDQIASKMKFGIFDIYRDRQITKKICSLTNEDNNHFYVLKAENITKYGIEMKKNQYYLNDLFSKQTAISKFIEKNKEKDFYVVPNMTYYPRMNKIDLTGKYIFDGSCVLFLVKEEYDFFIDIEFYHSEDFIYLWRIAQNYGTRSLNIDKVNSFYWGILK